jgi:hypothetical protein
MAAGSTWRQVSWSSTTARSARIVCRAVRAVQGEPRAAIPAKFLTARSLLTELGLFLELLVSPAGLGAAVAQAARAAVVPSAASQAVTEGQAARAARGATEGMVRRAARGARVATAAMAMAAGCTWPRVR